MPNVAQERGIALGMTFIDGTTTRANPNATGQKKGDAIAGSKMCARHLADLTVATAPRPA
ncbi:hypothetical protein JMJ56_19975 [Belnapia sp. T18]|uniref:Uncharacterized protein n=1 Tax=Belnapia arida TaxID=2804533 RepID=A0ABS1U6J9_9PROT|nr:hypothetical protein [Belnapia arida]